MPFIYSFLHTLVCHLFLSRFSPIILLPGSCLLPGSFFHHQFHIWHKEKIFINNNDINTSQSFRWPGQAPPKKVGELETGSCRFLDWLIQVFVTISRIMGVFPITSGRGNLEGVENEKKIRNCPTQHIAHSIYRIFSRSNRDQSYPYYQKKKDF